MITKLDTTKFVLDRYCTGLFRTYLSIIKNILYTTTKSL